MNKFMITLGILLIIISVPILVITISATDDESELSQVFESMVCNAPERLVINRSTSLGDDGQTINMYCEIEPGQRREVTATFVIITVVAFGIPFGLGMILTMWGAFRAQARARKNMSEYMVSMPDPKTGASTVVKVRGNINNMSPEAQQLINSQLGGVAGNVGKSSLTQRLQQLDDAYENDLISKEEYDRMRQAILDSMDD